MDNSEQKPNPLKRPRDETKPAEEEGAPNIETVKEEIESAKKAHNEQRAQSEVKQQQLRKKTFLDLGVNQWLNKNCAAMGLIRPTLIQEECIPPVLAGNVVLFVSFVLIQGNCMCF